MARKPTSTSSNGFSIDIPLQNLKDDDQTSAVEIDDASQHLLGEGSSATRDEARRAPTLPSPPATISIAWLLPRSLQQKLAPLGRWISGPPNVRLFRITPLFAPFQQVPPGRMSTRRLRVKFGLLFAYYVFLAGLFTFYLSQSAYSCEIPGFGTPKRLSCISRLWPDSKVCGVDGNRCRPFHDSKFAFRCPANCEGTKIWNPRFVGNIEINYQSLVVGGSPAYRGDSFICGAARHAGLISNKNGGAGVLMRLGERAQFLSETSNGISSIGFDPAFPLTFTFDMSNMHEYRGNCGDPRWVLLMFSTGYTFLISILTSSASYFFWTIFLTIYFTIALATNPPDAEDFLDVVSSAFGNLLPAACIGFVIYRYCVRPTLNELNAPLEKTILWLGACWVGALNNFTFDKLPIQKANTPRPPESARRYSGLNSYHLPDRRHRTGPSVGVPRRGSNATVSYLLRAPSCCAPFSGGDSWLESAAPPLHTCLDPAPRHCSSNTAQPCLPGVTRRTVPEWSGSLGLCKHRRDVHVVDSRWANRRTSPTGCSTLDQRGQDHVQLVQPDRCDWKATRSV